MNFTDYQREVKRTYDAPFPDRERPMVMALGLAGEAGEVADSIKKWAWHGKSLSPEDITNELGDVLWYLAALATFYGVSLEHVAEQNIIKLKQRYPDGFEQGGGRR